MNMSILWSFPGGRQELRLCTDPVEHLEEFLLDVMETTPASLETVVLITVMDLLWVSMLRSMSGRTFL